MVEQFRAVIDIDGDASGALRAIGQVEAAMQALDKGISRADIKIFKDDNARETLRGVNKEIRTLDSRIQRLKGSDLSSMLGLRNAETELGDIMRNLRRLPGQLRGKGFEVLDGNQERVLKNFESQISKVHDSAANALARVRSDIATTNKAFTQLEGALEDVDRGARRFKDTLSGSTGEMLKHHRALSTGSDRYRELLRNIRSARKELNQLQSEPMTSAGTRRALELTDTLKRQYAEAREIARTGVADIIREQKNLDRAEDGYRKAQEAARKSATRREAAERSLQNVLRSNVATQAELQRHLRDVSDEYDGLTRRAGAIRGQLSKVDIDSDPKKFRQLSDSLTDVVRAQTQVARPIVTQRVRELTKAENEYAKALDRTAKSSDKVQQARQRLNTTLANSVRGSQDMWRSLRSQSVEFDRLARSTAAYEGMLRNIDPRANALRFNEISDSIEGNLRAMERIARPIVTQSNRDFERQLAQERALIDKVERQAEDLRRAQAARNRQLLAPPGIRGDQYVADQWVADSNNEVAQATRRLAEAEAERARVFADSKSGDAARAAALHSQIAAQQALTRATREATNARINYDKAYNLKGSSARYALYDAAQYQMMRGAVQMAPLAASAFAYGRYESMFSDVQRTAEIDTGGRLADGRAALNLLDGFETASDRTFRNLLDISTKMPVALSDVFDIAAKGGSIGISGGRDIKVFTEALSMFNAISDADPAQSAEAIGRIGNLLGTTDYKGIASGVVELGKSAAATDDQILKTTQELSMAMAGTQFEKDEIIGLAGAFASLSIPPERARSVMLDFTNTMSKGLAKSTPELKSLSMILGKTEEQVRGLWKSEPSRLFQDLVKSLSSLDEDELVMALESIGLEGQRALPTFQALTKNWREMGDTSNVLTTSLAAANRGLNNSDLLDQAMANKTDDLAGKFQMLISKALEFATIFGSGSAPFAGAFLDTIGNMVKGLTAFLSIPGIGQIAGIASTILGVAGAFRMASGIGALFQAGKMSMDQIRGLTGAAQHAGSLSYLLTGKDRRDQTAYNKGAAARAGAGGVAGVQPAMKPGAVQDVVDDNVPRGGATVDIDPVMTGGSVTREAGEWTRRATPEKLFRRLPTSRVELQTPMRLAVGRNDIQGAVEIARANVAFRREIEKIPNALKTPIAKELSNSVAAELPMTLGERVGPALKTGWTRALGFVGGGFNMAMIGVTAVAAAAGAIQSETIRRQEVAEGNLVNQLTQRVFVPDEATGKVGPISREELLSVLITETKDAMSWTDKTFSYSGMFTPTAQVMSELRNVTPENLRTYARMAVTGGGVPGQTHNITGAMAGRFGASVKEFGEAIGGFDLDTQISSMDALFDISKLSPDTLAMTLDAMYKDNRAGYDQLVAGLNEFDPSLQLSTVWDAGGDDPGQFRREVAAAMLKYVVSKAETGEASTSGSNYQNIVGARTDTVIGEYAEQSGRYKNEMNALGAYYETLEAATEYAKEYGRVLEDNGGILDMSNAKHREVFGIMGAINDRTFQRVSAMRTEGRTMKDIAAALTEGYDEFVKFGEAVGMSEAQIAELAESMGMLPEQIISDIIMKTSVSGTMKPEDLLDILDALPDGKSVTVEALGTEQLLALRDAGYAVKKIVDESGNLVWVVTAREQGLQEIADKLTRVNEQGKIEVDLSVLGDEARAELDGLAGQIGDLKAGSSITLDATLSDEATGALLALGFEVERFVDENGNPQVKITATDETAGIAGTIKESLAGITNKNVVITITVEGDPVPEFDGGKFKSPILRRPRPAPAPAPAPITSPTPTPAPNNPFLDPSKMNDVPRVNSATVITPSVDLSDANTGLDDWALKYVPTHFAPTPMVNADTTPATGVAKTWFGVTGALNPTPGVSANASSATGTSLQWYGMAHGLKPNPMMTSNAAPAGATAMQWFAMASAMRPVATLMAVAATGAAEAALNWAARTRHATIVVSTVGGGVPKGGFSSGGFTGRGGKWEPAGIVHKGEYVIPKSQVNQATGLPYMDALGRLARGIVGSPTGYKRGNANIGGGSSGVIELGPATIHRLAQKTATILELDGKVVADNTSRNFRNSTRRGRN